MAGRPPKPVALKILQGNPGKRRLLSEPRGDPLNGDCAPPKYLRPDAKHFWKNYVEQLRTNGILTTLDLHVLEMASYWYAEFRRRERLARKNDEPRDWRETRFASREFDKFSAQLGLSPTARTRLAMSDARKKGQESALARRLFG